MTAITTPIDQTAAQRIEELERENDELRRALRMAGALVESALTMGDDLSAS